METNPMSWNTILISAAVIFIVGAVIGGRIVTYFYFIFGRRGERSRRRSRNRRRDDRYDDDRYDSGRYEDDYEDQPRPSLGLYFVVIVLLGLFAFLGYQRYMGRNVGQELAPANHSEYESYGSSRQPPSGSKNGTTTAPKTTESLNRGVYDPAYAPAAPENSPIVADVADVADVAEAPARAVPKKYLIQKGTFSDWEGAKAKMKGMSEQGMNAGYWKIKSADGSPAYAVFTGMFRSRLDAKVFRQVRCNGKGSIRSSEGLDLRAFKE
ncbi:MAG: SPOR domain-containing protein [Saprospiraceae bacterium]|nr:SPOR domain-containing protein [Saprospiraceae bacterium]